MTARGFPADEPIHCDGPDCSATRPGPRYGPGLVTWLAVEHNEDRFQTNFCSFECLAGWAVDLMPAPVEVRQ